MPPVGFELTTPVFEQAKTVHMYGVLGVLSLGVKRKGREPSP
jgi:hypothetical protein